MICRVVEGQPLAKQLPFPSAAAHADFEHGWKGLSVELLEVRHLYLLSIDCSQTLSYVHVWYVADDKRSALQSKTGTPQHPHFQHHSPGLPTGLGSRQTDALWVLQSAAHR